MTLIKCKTCSADIAKNAKTCPSCGAKNKKPIYKRWWIPVLIVFVAMGIIGNLLPNDETNSPDQPAQGTANVNNESNTDTDGGDNSEEGSEEDSTNLIDGKYEITEDFTSTGDSFAIYISGTLKNTTKKTYSYAQITFNLYDANGNQVGTALDNISNWEAGGTWKFKAMGIADDAAGYKFIEISAF